MEYKRKLLPVEPYEIHLLEKWFSDLSAEGLFLVRINSVFATFAVKEPKRLLYHMEPKEKNMEDYPNQEQVELYEEYGWTFLSSFREYFYIFSAEEGTAEIHSDPLVESSLIQPHAAKTKNYFWIGVMFLIFHLISGISRLLLFSEHRTYRLVHGDIPFPSLMNTILCLALVFQCFHTAKGFEKVYRQLATGTPVSSIKTSYKKAVRIHKLFFYLIPTVFVCGVIFTFLPFSLSYSEKPMAEISHPLPFVALAEIEEDANFYPTASYIEKIGSEGDDWWEMKANIVSFYTELGAPVQFSITQHGKNPEITDESGNPYEAHLVLDYKKFSSFVSPQKYLEELFTLPQFANWEITPLADTPFDYAVLAKKDNYTKLFMIQGQKMLEAYYVGNANLTEHYSLFDDVLQGEYHR